MAFAHEVDHGWMHGKIFRLKIDCPGASEYEGYWKDGQPVMRPTPYQKGDLVKVVMVSRFGDCGITTNLQARNGYAWRVEPEDLTPKDFERRYRVVKPVLTWKGRLLDTYGALFEAMRECKTPEDSKKFMEYMRENDPNADDNVGYLTGYCGTSEAQRMRAWFGVKHPVFGDTDPTPREAFQKGLEMGRQEASEQAESDLSED